MQAGNALYDDPIDRSAVGSSPWTRTSETAATDALQVSLLGLDEIGEALRAEWRDLNEKAATPNPCFAPWFLEPAMRHLDPSREVKLCLLRWGETGLLVGLLPLVFQTGYSKLPLKHACVWTHRHCFNGAPLVRDGHDVAVYAGLFDWIDTRPEAASFIRFPMLPFDRAAHLAVEEACDLRTRSYRIQAFHERAILTGKTEFDGVMSDAMADKKREELCAHDRQFDALGEVEISSVALSDLKSVAEISGLAQQFLDLEKSDWKGTKPGGYPLAESAAESRFFREVMTEGAMADAIDCLSLKLDGDPKAMLLILRLGTHRALFQASYDENLIASSPGLRLLMEATRQMLDSDAEELDSCACPEHPVVDRLWSERKPIAQINVPAHRMVDKTLLGTAATIEAVKNSALKRLNLRGEA